MRFLLTSLAAALLFAGCSGCEEKAAPAPEPAAVAPAPAPEPAPAAVAEPVGPADAGPDLATRREALEGGPKLPLPKITPPTEAGFQRVQRIREIKAPRMKPVGGAAQPAPAKP